MLASPGKSSQIKSTAEVGRLWACSWNHLQEWGAGEISVGDFDATWCYESLKTWHSCQWTKHRNWDPKPWKNLLQRATNERLFNFCAVMFSAQVSCCDNSKGVQHGLLHDNFFQDCCVFTDVLNCVDLGSRKALLEAEGWERSKVILSYMIYI